LLCLEASEAAAAEAVSKICERDFFQISFLNTRAKPASQRQISAVGGPATAAAGLFIFKQRADGSQQKRCRNVKSKTEK
jgi:hypothetical protein